MRSIGLFWMFCLTVQCGRAQPYSRLDSTFTFASASDFLVLFQERPPIQQSFDVSRSVHLSDWQRVPSVHYGNESPKGRAFFTCKSAITQTVWLELTSHFIDTVRVTLVRPDTVIRYRAISYPDLALVPDLRWPFLPVRHPYFVFAISLLAHQPTTVFIESCVQPGDHLKFGVQVWEPTHFLAHQQQDTWLWAFFVGIFMMAILISLLNYLLDTQLIYLYYATYVACLMLFALINDGWGVSLPPWLQWLDSRYAYAYCLNVGLYSFFLFCRRFLSLPPLTVRNWDNPLWLLLFVGLMTEVVRYTQATSPGSSSDLSYRIGVVGVTGYGILLVYYVVASLRRNTNPIPTVFLLAAILSMFLYY